MRERTERSRTSPYKSRTPVLYLYRRRSTTHAGLSERKTLQNTNDT